MTVLYDDPADENDYGLQRGPTSTGLCSRCKEDAALPNEEWCRDCVIEIETALAELEERAA